MSNSSLVSYTKISPNSSARTGKISKITPHHMAGNLSVETCGEIFSRSSRQASANYGIGSDGRIALYVDESRRSWASSSAANDQRAVTIEVANSSRGGDWPVSTAAWNSLVTLCVDICRRNGIARLDWTGDASGSLTTHDMFVATACPGPYLKARMPLLAKAVNERLGAGAAGAGGNAGSSGALADLGDLNLAAWSTGLSAVNRNGTASAFPMQMQRPGSFCPHARPARLSSALFKARWAHRLMAGADPTRSRVSSRGYLVKSASWISMGCLENKLARHWEKRC